MRKPQKVFIFGFIGSLVSIPASIQAQSFSSPTVQVNPAPVAQNVRVLGTKVLGPSPAIVPLQHVPANHAGPIDLSKYSADVLNCEICRQRLGLPPIKPVVPNVSGQGSVAAGQPTDRAALTVESNPTIGRTLGGSGLITAGDAKQLEASGLIINEFRPPVPKQEDFRLESIPPEVRQQFYQQLELPSGARIMSAQVVTKDASSGSNTESKETLPQNDSSPSQTLGAPGIDLKSSANSSTATASIVEKTQPAKTIEPVRNEEEVVEAITATSPANPPPTELTKIAEPTKAAEPAKKQDVPAPSASNDSKKSEPKSQALPKATESAESAASLSNLEKAIAESRQVAEQMKAENAALAKQLSIANEAQKEKDRQLAEVLSSNRKVLSEAEVATAERIQLQKMMNAQTESFEKSLAEMERANQETAKMLEARTMEITKLQNQLKAQEGANKKPSKDLNSPKKKPNKKPAKEHE